MDKTWLWFIVTVWIIGTILSTSMDKVAVGSPIEGGNTTTQSTLTYLADVRNVSYKSNAAGTSTFVLFNEDYFDKWGDVLKWNYSFLQGNDYADMFKYIVLYPLTLVTMAMFVGAFIWMLSNIWGH